MLRVSVYLIPTLLCFTSYFFTLILAKTIAWQQYKPTTCTSDVNYTLPRKRIDLDIALWVNAIYDISEGKMQFGMQIDLLEFWEDPFMKFNTDEAKKTHGSLLVPKEVVACIWKPDTLFQNAKDVMLYTDTAPNIVYKVVLPDGYLMRRSRYKITVACPMRFHYYPMDSQVCKLQICLHRSRKNHVHLKWSEDFNIFELDDPPVNFAISPLPKTKSEKLNAKVNVTTEFLFANFLFDRSLSASLFNTYLPSLLVVSLSMVSFWLDVGAVPGRVTLGVTSILTLSTQIVRARSGLPTLNYMTAMDVWLLCCLIMVFLSLIEFTLASSYVRKKAAMAKLKEAKEAREKILALPPRIEVPRIKSTTIRSRYLNRFSLRFNLNKLRKFRDPNGIQPTKKKATDNIYDRASRIIFPLTMVVFSCCYWLYYLNMAEKEKQRILGSS